MDDEEKAAFREKFKLMVHESNGAEFENLFSKIMNYSEKGFQQVKPHGNIGDRKNDGWIELDGTYFQVYSPEEINRSISKSVNKLQEDFRGLYNSWDYLRKINNFYFVLNDKFKGPPVNLVTEIQKIKNKYNLNDARALTAIDLEKKVFQLEDDIILTIIGRNRLKKVSYETDLKYFQFFVTHSKISSIHKYLEIDTIIDGRILGIDDAYNELKSPTNIGYPFQDEKLQLLFKEFMREYQKTLNHIKENYEFRCGFNNFRMIKGKEFSEEAKIMTQHSKNKFNLFKSIVVLTTYTNTIFTNIKY
ncbi:hypothetical protein N2M06_13135 [Oceanimonas sp. AH20CE76]|uniref:hypothetical protein n=1 Tax=Oceanimonas sp. AH20CE76 TaxID=2977120 RepID=UPI0031FF292C